MFVLSPMSRIALLLLAMLISQQVSAQLPEDMQRELNQNLAEQARIQAMRQQHQKQIQNRAGGQQANPSKPNHDPNNYSYQQVSPPIQYSYYQPFGDAAQPAAGNQQQNPGPTQRSDQAANFDLNNMNFDLPQPQAQVGRSPAVNQQLTPSFTGVGGLPVMRPVAASANQPLTPVGQLPLAPQAQVQQGPPLTEADFKDITGGENYGAPGNSDFGLGQASNGGAAGNRASDTDAQLREFGMPMEGPARPAQRQAGSNAGMGGMNIPDLGGFNPMSGAGPTQRADNGFGADFGDFAGFGTGGRGGANSRPASGNGNEFDFASQPSGENNDQAASSVAGGAPGSLQSLLGSSFPGLSGGGSNSGLDGFAGPANNPQASNQRNDDNSLDIADLGEKSDQFSGADLGNFEQPNPQNDQDFNYAAASNQQPKSVPYPDGGVQPVGALLAVTQPQSLSQTRYNALPDKGTYQDYPAYLNGGDEFNSVSEVVDNTPSARRPGVGRYSNPSARQLAPENRVAPGHQYDYSQAPGSSERENHYDNLD